MALFELLDPAIPEAGIALDFLGTVLIDHLSLLKPLWVRILSRNKIHILFIF